MTDSDEPNPFAAPESDIGPGGYEELADGAPAYKLYSPGQVTWATFLGSPIAGCAVLATNYSRLGNIGSALTILIIGLLISVGLCLMAMLRPSNYPGTIISVIYTVSLYYVANGLQGPTYRRHLAAGGRQASSWAATGIAIACIFLFIVIAFALALAMDLGVDV